MNALNTPRKKVVSYLISLKECSLNRLTLLAGDKKIPSYHYYRKEGGLNRIIDLQIELFIALDTLSSSNKVAGELIDYENRFTALLANLRQ